MLGHAPQHKASAVASTIAMQSLGRAVWTPANYGQLADEGYQKNVIVYRCVNLIARGVASVPWLLYDDKGELEAHALLDLLDRPSPRQAGTSFIEAVIGYLLLSGNAYVEAVVDQHGQPEELYTLRPDRMQVIPGMGGMPLAFDYRVNGQVRRLDCNPVDGGSSVLHLKSFHPLHDWYGLSPLEAAAKSIDQHNHVAEHNLALLQNGGRPSGAFIFKNNRVPLNDLQREYLRQELKSYTQGAANAGQVLVCEGDFEWREMGLSPKDLDFIEGKNISAREIAQAFGVPPMLVGISGDATYANYKEARYHLWEDTIIPLLEFLVAELNLWLCPMFGETLFLDYDTDQIPALAQRREAIWNKVMAANFLTINEKREAVGYSPIAGGDGLSAKETT